MPGRRSRGVRLLVACVRAGLEHADADMLRTLLPDAGDWPAFLERAEWERLAGVLHFQLHRPELRASIPDAAWRSLEHSSMGSAARNMRLTAGLGRIARVLDHCGIETIALKGAGLLATVYDSPALRPMGDLDLLVRGGRLDAARSALDAAGFSQARAGERWTPDEHHHAPAMVSADGLVSVELHHTIAAGFDPSGFWSRARQATVGGALVRVPDAVDMVLHLGVHLFSDRMQGRPGSLRALFDIARVIERDAVDWDLLVREARSRRVDRRVFYALHATRRTAGAAVPRTVLDALAPPGGSRLADRYVERRVLRDRPWPRRRIGTRAAPAHGTARSRTLRRAGLLLSYAPRPRRFVQDVRLYRMLRACADR